MKDRKFLSERDILNGKRANTDFNPPLIMKWYVGDLDNNIVYQLKKIK